jgi:hypothetical protein
MPRKKPEKKILLLEPSYSDILACQKKEFRPYLEVMILEGENVTHENLGTLLGILEINDDSEDSSYIVNYILSIIKKEYFSKGKRGAIESFESALHKANLALSKLAQHENISWIGKFNALIAVIEKNNLHFSQAGKALALLMRNNLLTDISQGMSEEGSPNPLKTFTNLSSGKMEEGDKLILANPEIFDIFSLEEIKKSALRFSNADFIQFLKTALGNELKKAAVLVADISEKQVEQKKSLPLKNKGNEINAFSQKTYIPKARPREEKREILNDLENALEKENSNDAKYGHIYIKEELESQNNKGFSENKFAFKSALRNFFRKTRGKKSGEKIKNYAGKITSEIKKKELGKRLRFSLAVFWKKMADVAKIIFQKMKSLAVFLKDKIRKFASSRKTNPPEYPAQSDISLNSSPTMGDSTALGDEIYKPAWKKILPSFSVIAKNARLLSRRQQAAVLIIFVLIFIIPIFIARRINTAQNKTPIQSPPSQNSADIAPDVSLEDSNILKTENAATAFSGKNIQGIINLNDLFFVVASNSLVELPGQKVWTIPEDFGEISKFTAMNDLNLIFLSNKENRVISFSPNSEKFQENSLALPENSQIRAMGTFMTYLYVLDPKNNQIYRFPRAEGGFGEKTNWLKVAADLSGYENMFVTDSIYLWGKENFAKFFRGKNENITLENYSAYENIRALYSDENFIYILDKNNGKIIEFDAAGKMLAQIALDKIKTAESLAVANDKKTFYISSPNEITSFSIQ